ncbi:hypothetical protein OQA88_7170 [Cercophora sp. LCS_1]
MDMSHLPTHLVTAQNPARTDLGTLDHPRCAALHNYLVHCAWLAESRPVSADLLNNSNTFFTGNGGAASVFRERLHPSVVAFLGAALLPPSPGPHRAPAPFFWWATALNNTEDLFANPVAGLFDEPEDSLLCLYWPGQGGEAGGGVYYHQGIHRAAVFMHMDDHDFAMPAWRNPTLWHPLETILSNWIELLRLGKVAATPPDAPSLFGNERSGPWEWRVYSEAQVDACVHAWDRLCEAIEVRRRGVVAAKATMTAEEPLLTSAALDAAAVPDPGFARAFLSRARRPTFLRIGPGLTAPPSDAASFAAMQSYTRLPRLSGNHIPPVCLFPAAPMTPDQLPLVNMVTEVPEFMSPAWDTAFYFEGFKPFEKHPDAVLPSRVPAGVYSEAVDRSCYDNTEEGFRLLLPYGLIGGKNNDRCMWDPVIAPVPGARTSDGSFVKSSTGHQLFQHGYKPLGGDYYRPQRLERLLDHWAKLVADGVWSVGPDGVEGTIDKFKEADVAAHWRDYIIPPSW